MSQWVNHGFSLDGGHNSTDSQDANAILIDPLFKKAKNDDKEAAASLWEREWNRNAGENERRLSEATAGAQEVIFISVPGTSRKNRIPLAAAEFLALKVGNRARFINGDRAFIPVHTSMMKSISRGERIFHPRVFETTRSVFKTIRETWPNARFFVVEDLLTTGNSAHSFQRYLEKNGLNISGMIAMKGEYEPNVAPNLVKKIDKFFKQNDIPVNAEKLSRELTGKEAQTLAFQVAAQYKKADLEHQNLFRKLFETLYDIRVNDNHKALPEMNRLSADLSRYLQSNQKRKEEQHENITSISSNHPESRVSQILGSHSERGTGQPDTAATAEIGSTSATDTLRNDGAIKQPTRTSTVPDTAKRLNTIARFKDGPDI